MKFFVTGDAHGNFNRFYMLPEEIKHDSDVGVIILGDAGWNFFLNNTDTHKKRDFHNNFDFYVYCVRGNHEARPQSVKGMESVWDSNVSGEVYYEPQFPRIRYFYDYGAYIINGLYTLIIGGAYSVDKYYRLVRAGVQEDENNPKKTGWWADEQLTEEEREGCYQVAGGIEWDLVLSHTCPISWEPTDLFLSSVDQSSVDSSMEEWMEDLKKNVKWNTWLFGHFHDDRLVRPHVEMLYRDVEPLGDIIKRWDYWDEHGELDAWWYNKDPKFYWED